MRTTIIAVAAIGLLGVGAWSLLRPPADPTVAPTAAGDADAVTVTLAEVRVGEASLHHRTSGTVVAAEGVPMPSPLDTAIDGFAVEDGDRVEAGDVIVRLQQTAEAAAVMSAEARVEQAEAVLERARSMADAELTISTDIDMLEADLERVTVRLETAREAVQARTLRAPFAGEVRLHDELTIGTMVMRGQSLATISTDDRLLVRFDIPRELQPSAPAGTTIEVEGPEGAVAEAVIEAEMAGEAQVGDRITLEATLASGSEGFAVDDDVVVRIPVERVEPRPLVPAEALAEGPTGAVVYRVTGGVARSVPVQTGAASEAGVEVMGAIQPGDRVVVAGVGEVSDGVRVRED